MHPRLGLEYSALEGERSAGGKGEGPAWTQTQRLVALPVDTKSAKEAAFVSFFSKVFRKGK